jgi:hypothetical protein
MKTDVYTKIVLTVIAVCLVILVSSSFDSGFVVSSAHAQTFGAKEIVDVNIVRKNGQEFGQVVEPPSINPPALPVKIREK